MAGDTQQPAPAGRGPQRFEATIHPGDAGDDDLAPRAVAQPLDDAAGRSAPEVIRRLMARGPQPGGQPPG
jgi:hypothetical protein